MLAKSSTCPFSLLSVILFATIAPGCLASDPQTTTLVLREWHGEEGVAQHHADTASKVEFQKSEQSADHPLNFKVLVLVEKHARVVEDQKEAEKVLGYVDFAVATIRERAQDVLKLYYVTNGFGVISASDDNTEQRRSQEKLKSCLVKELIGHLYKEDMKGEPITRLLLPNPSEPGLSVEERGRRNELHQLVKRFVKEECSVNGMPKFDIWE